MLQLTQKDGRLGPFSAIETLADRYVCDGVHLQFSVVGDCVVEDWVGSLPVPPEPSPIVPNAITMRQARLVLLGMGVLTKVDAAINSLPEPQKSAAKITWEYSTEVQRHNGLVLSLGPALGLSESQIDAMFIQGAVL